MNNRELAYNLRNSIRGCLCEELDLYLSGEYGRFDREAFFTLLREETATYIDELEHNDELERIGRLNMDNNQAIGILKNLKTSLKFVYGDKAKVSCEALEVAIEALDPRNDPHYDECDYCKYNDSLDDYPCSECKYRSKWEKKEEEK